MYWAFCSSPAITHLILLISWSSDLWLDWLDTTGFGWLCHFKNYFHIGIISTVICRLYYSLAVNVSGLCFQHCGVEPWEQRSDLWEPSLCPQCRPLPHHRVHQPQRQHLHLRRQVSDLQRLWVAVRREHYFVNQNGSLLDLNTTENY